MKSTKRKKYIFAFFVIYDRIFELQQFDLDYNNNRTLTSHWKLKNNLPSIQREWFSIQMKTMPKKTKQQSNQFTEKNQLIISVALPFTNKQTNVYYIQLLYNSQVISSGILKIQFDLFNFIFSINNNLIIEVDSMKREVQCMRLNTALIASIRTLIE